ncbi:hypothetical protein ACIP6X_34375 [Streptomyces coeruleorubidus]|uniref:hypothetical protein n=1 Tax=Streptomyces coeruleorubidus TaxID=116188 RepID=UPI0038146B15
MKLGDDMRHAVRTAATAALAIIVAGCSSNDGGDKRADANDGGGRDTTASALKFAKAYQEADNGQDWQRVCQMRTDRYRDGTIQQCVAGFHVDTAEPTPSVGAESDPPPLVRADGSTVAPRQTRTVSGPERAQLGPVKATGSKAVPPCGDHPAGMGVMVEYTYTWPDDSGVQKYVLRLVQQNGKWSVDQREEVADSDEAHGDPILDALMRS